METANIWQVHVTILPSASDDAFGITFAIDANKLTRHEAVLRYVEISMQQLGFKASDYTLDFQLEPDK